MLRLAILLIGLVGLAGCGASVMSDQALITPNDQRLRNGLWAVLELGCERPATSIATIDWPDCAYPVRVATDDATLSFSSFPDVAYALLLGSPSLLQIRDDRDQSFYYWALEPVRPGQPLDADLSVWRVTCGDEATPTDVDCAVDSLEALHQMAERSRTDQSLTATWIRADDD